MARRPAPPTFDWRDRVQELRYMLPQDLVDHPLQHKLHGPAQEAVMRGALTEVGIADVLRVYQSPSTGAWTLIDGHMRKGLGTQAWPAIVLDVTDAEAAYLLLLGDEIAALHEKDDERLLRLLAEVQSTQAPVQALLERLREPASPPVPWIFHPSLAPTSTSRQVTEHDLDDAQDRIQATITAQKPLVPLICPHCLHEFSIDPTTL